MGTDGVGRYRMMLIHIIDPGWYDDYTTVCSVLLHKRSPLIVQRESWCMCTLCTKCTSCGVLGTCTANQYCGGISGKFYCYNDFAVETNHESLTREKYTYAAMISE